MVSLFQGYPQGSPAEDQAMLANWVTEVERGYQEVVLGIEMIVLSAALVMGAVGVMVKVTGMGGSGNESR